MTLGAAFDVFRAAREVPQAPAVLLETGQLSYAELGLRARAALDWLGTLAGDLQELSESGRPVALLASPELEQVIMTWALVSAGIPILPLHPRLVPAERERLLELTGAIGPVVPGWHEQHRAARSVELPRLPFDDEALLALVATSGSSGAPRLARLSRRAFAASARASARRLGWLPGDRWLLSLPFAHVGGLSILTRCLQARKPVVLARSSPPAGAPSSGLAEALTGHAVSLCSLVPTQLERLLSRAAWQPPASLRAVLVGGAACSVELLERARARGLRALPTYGMTETCSQLCTRSPEPTRHEAGVGRPLDGARVRVVRGQIEVRGPLLFSGYWTEATPHPPGRWFRTGDLGHFDEHGCLHVSGRASELIISGGENVSPAEVEQALAPALEGRRIAVFGLEDAHWGQRVALAIEGPEAGELLERVARVATRELASFKRPRLAAFLPRLPELASGKLDRRSLCDSCAPVLISIDYAGVTPSPWCG